MALRQEPGTESDGHSFQRDCGNVRGGRRVQKVRAGLSEDVAYRQVRNQHTSGVRHRQGRSSTVLVRCGW